ncbi:hypothetical protein LCGC14_0984540 [marine sediment metagenome]|uniref:Uncharacterized protein n=1 Tax=marine sediment metagenome TaxID=412755 RepID=A0A0F9NCA1_9ZZZZ
MILSIELTDTEYVAAIEALKHASALRRSFAPDTHRLELLHLMTLLAEASISDRHDDDVPESGIVASVYLQGLSEQWNDAGVTMDEARDWHKLPPIRQIQVVERMLSIVSLLTSLTEPETTS